MTAHLRKWLLFQAETRGAVLAIAALCFWQCLMTVVFLWVAIYLFNPRREEFWFAGVIGLRAFFAYLWGDQLGTGFGSALSLWQGSRRDESLRITRVYAFSSAVYAIIAVTAIDIGLGGSPRELTSTRARLVYFALDLGTQGALHASILLFLVAPLFFREDKDKIQITEDLRL